MPGLEETENEFRYRIKEPSLFVDGSFKSKALPTPGLRLIIGKLKSAPDGSTVTQSIRFSKSDWDKSKAMAWVRDHKDQFSIEPAPLFRINDVEIFSTGEWNGRNITEQDLDNIVTAFSKTNGTVRPFLKLGHDDEQGLLQVEGLPAAGWVENVRKIGTKLVADFCEVPRKIYQLLKNKAYRKVSCEIYNNIKLNGEQFPKMLGAVALLGGELPAVLNLDDILSLYSSDQGFTSVQECFTTKLNCDTIISDDIKIIKDDPNMDEVEKLKFKLEQSEKKNEDLETKLQSITDNFAKMQDDFKSLKTMADNKDKEIIEAKQREHKAHVEKFVTDLKADKLCNKAMEPMLFDLFDDQKEEYSIGEKKFDKFGLVKEIIKGASEVGKINFYDATSDSRDGGGPTDTEKVEKYAKDNDMSFGDAYRALHRKA